MKEIQISVVIPLFNKEKHILETLASVLYQRYPVSEIIIVDDGSTDNGAEIVAQAKISNLRLIRQQNQGVSAARNAGIAAAKYPYIAFLDADDHWLPFFTEEMFHLIQRFPDAKAYTSRYQCVEPGDKYVDAKIHLDGVDPYGMLLDNYFEMASKGDLPFMMSSTMVRKEVFDAIGGFPVGEKMGEDQDIFAKIALHGDIAYCPNITLLYHRDSDNRACDIHIPSEECGFSKRLHAMTNELIDETGLSQDITRYSAAHLCHLAKRNLMHNKPAVALQLLSDKRCRAKPKHFVALSLWAYMQTFNQSVAKLLFRNKTTPVPNSL